MKYCVQCRKVLSALGLDRITICMASGHEFTEITFDDLYKRAERLGEKSTKGCKLMGICHCHYNTTNCCKECRR